MRTLHGGIRNLQIPVTEIQGDLGIKMPMNIEANVTANITTLMLASMSPPPLIIAEGVLVSTARLRKA